MAGDWMKIELELPDKPEVHAIAGMLNIDPDSVVGKLIRVWQWFDKHTTDGNAYGVTYSLPDRISGVIGFGEAMAFVGWLEQRDKTLVMPKFDRHTSASAKTRALTAKRVASHKSKINAESNDTGNGVSVSDALPREDKRRYKENNKKKVQDCPEDFSPNQNQIDFCTENRIDLTAELAKFLNHHRSNGKKFVDWHAALWTWLHNAVGFKKNRSSASDDIFAGAK